MTAEYSALLATGSHIGILLGLFFDPEDEAICSSKRRLTFNELHSIIAQKTVLFIATAVRNTNPTKNTFLRFLQSLFSKKAISNSTPI
jgi:hypothetical protein